MGGGDYDVLLLRPQDIADVIDMGKAIDLVEQGYREAQDFPLVNAPRRRVHSRKNARRAMPSSNRWQATSISFSTSTGRIRYSSSPQMACW